MAVLEREFFLEFWKTLRCLWFCGTKTYHKVLAHPSHPLVVRVDTFKGCLHTSSSWLVAAGLFPEGVLFVSQCVCDQENLHYSKRIRSTRGKIWISLIHYFSFIKPLGS